MAVTKYPTQMVSQTRRLKDGDDNWGRLFVVAGEK